MIIFGSYLLKVCACSALLYLYYHVALRNKIFHQWNRFYLLFAVVISLAAPLLQLHLFSPAATQADRSIHLLRVVQSANEYLDEVTITRQPSSGPAQWGLMLYFAVSATLLLMFLRSVTRIYSIIRTHVVQYVGRIRFVNTRVKGAPFSFFRYIFWNDSIDVQSNTGQQIFQHELVHVKEKHSLDTVFMQTLLALFWCNPFFWLIRRELKLIHEFIADKKSVGEHGAAAFAAMVLQSAYPLEFSSMVNSFFHTSIKRRILMLKKLQTRRLSYLSRVLALPVIVCAILAFTVKVKPIRVLPLESSITVVIDAGHGILPNGGKDGAVVNDMSEEQVVLALAKKIEQSNQNKKIHIVLTRRSPENVDLHKRVDIARENKADLFISLHMGANVEDADAASSNARSHGIDIYVSNRQPAYQQQSEVFGSVLREELSTVYDVNPDLLKRKTGIWVLDQNVCPSVLLECGFITNQKDRNFISAVQNQDILAQKILYSIERFAASRNEQSIKNINSSAIGENLEMTVPSNENEKEQIASGSKSSNLSVRGGTSVANAAKLNISERTMNEITDTVPHSKAESHKTEQAASIDPATWRNFLSTHLMDVLDSLVQKAPPGQYTAYMRFIVKKDGSLDDLTVEKDPGYGVGEKLLKVLKLSPKWTPAYAHGRPVNSYHTQPVTLVIQTP